MSGVRGYVRGTKVCPGYEGTRVCPGYEGMSGVVRGTRVCPGYEGMSGVVRGTRVRGYVRGTRVLVPGYEGIRYTRVLDAKYVGIT